MQAITFTNPYGDTVTFARGFPYILEKISGTGTVESKPLTQRGFMQDGTHYFSSLLEPRELSLTLWIQGTSRADLLGKRNEVMSAFNPKAGEGTLRYSNDAGTWEIASSVKRLVLCMVAIMQRQIELGVNGDVKKRYDALIEQITKD